MSSQLKHVPAQETYMREGEYTSNFLKWKGYVDRHPLLASEINANAEAACSSWRTYGDNDVRMARILDEWDGNGKEDVILITSNQLKISMIGGDSYGEIILGDTKEESDVPVNNVTLPPDNITQVIKHGRIKRYYEISGNGEWKPQEIFHLAYNPIVAMTHGHSQVQRLEKILLHKEQLLNSGSKIFERYIKPTNIVYTKSDDPTEVETIKTDFENVNKTDQANIYIPEGQISKIERMSVPVGSTLDPSVWIRNVLDPEIIRAWRMAEVLLGTGTVNSEESARYQFTGFRQKVRFDQKFLSVHMKGQIFKLAFPDDTPGIRWSFATEAQEEQWERVLKAAQNVSAWPMPDDVKQAILGNLGEEIGLVPKS